MKKLNFKKHGCLLKSAIFIVVTVVIIVVAIFSMKDSLQILGLKFETFKKYMNLLNEEVDVSAIVTNPISAEDYNNFVTKANAAGFDVFDAQNNINISKGVIDLNQDLNLTSKELGAFMQKVVSTANLADQEDFELLELSVLPTATNNVYNFKTVAKINLNKSKAELGNNGKDFPAYLYLTTSSSCGVVSNRFVSFSSSVKLNNLSKDDNTNILSFIEEVFSTENQPYSLSSLVNNYLFSQLETIALKSSSSIILGLQTYTLKK